MEDNCLEGQGVAHAECLISVVGRILPESKELEMGIPRMYCGSLTKSHISNSNPMSGLTPAGLFPYALQAIDHMLEQFYNLLKVGVCRDFVEANTCFMSCDRACPPFHVATYSKPSRTLESLRHAQGSSHQAGHCQRKAGITKQMHLVCLSTDRSLTDLPASRHCFCSTLCTQGPVMALTWHAAGLVLCQSRQPVTLLRWLLQLATPYRAGQQRLGAPLTQAPVLWLLLL